MVDFESEHSGDGADRAVALFEGEFGAGPEFVVRAPGRVNLIGEHTDYSEGLVLPMAVDRCLWLAGRSTDGPLVRLLSGTHGRGEFDVRSPAARDGWMAYSEGVAHVMAGDARLPGFDAAVVSEIPAGAGLSSSAAFEMALVAAFALVGGRQLEPIEAARVGWRVEKEWLRLGSGMMDQIACMAGRKDYALLIDCRDLSVEYVPIPATAAVVVLDTATRRSLTESRYRLRSQESEEAAAAFGVDSLRDLENVQNSREDIDPTLVRRARHVVNENNRVRAAATALRSGDLAETGRLLSESHRSLRDDYEVSGPELDAIVEAAMGAPGCLGARMMGGGFAGCAVALVDAGLVEDFAAATATTYETATGLHPSIFRCRPVDGTSVAPLSNT